MSDASHPSACQIDEVIDVAVSYELSAHAALERERDFKQFVVTLWGVGT